MYLYFQESIAFAKDVVAAAAPAVVAAAAAAAAGVRAVQLLRQRRRLQRRPGQLQGGPHRPLRHTGKHKLIFFEKSSYIFFFQAVLSRLRMLRGGGGGGGGFGGPSPVVNGDGGGDGDGDSSSSTVVSFCPDRCSCNITISNQLQVRPLNVERMVYTQYVELLHNFLFLRSSATPTSTTTSPYPP